MFDHPARKGAVCALDWSEHPSNPVERGCGRNVGPARGGREDLSPTPYIPGHHKRSAALGALNGPNDADR
jgi:hypothetical protein